MTHPDLPFPRPAEPFFDRAEYCRAFLMAFGFLSSSESQSVAERIRKEKEASTEKGRPCPLT